MKTVTESQINGNKGEAFVSHLLSRHCLVRQVTSGTDVGIDLYCETINSSKQVHNHFWVQVKASKAGRFKALRERDIQYWKRQPIPVFIFKVYLDKGVTSNRFLVRVVNLVDEFLKAGPSKYPSPKGMSYTTLQTETDIEFFINAVVPEAVSRREFLDGIILPIKPVEEQYLKEYPSLENFHKFEKEIFTQIGRAARFLIQDLSSKGADFQKEKRKHAAEILATFHHLRWKWDFHFYYGESKLLDGEYDVAIRAFEQSLDIFTNDGKIKDLLYDLKMQENYQRQISMIEERISLCSRFLQKK